MLENSVKILLIEDNLAEARLLQEFLKQTNCQKCSLLHVKRLGDALVQLSTDSQEQHLFDIILLDLTLPDSEGLASLSPLKKLAPGLPIVVLTNTNDEELAIEAVRQGAQDYLLKRQVNPDSLLRSIRYAIERKLALESLRIVNETLEVRVQKSTDELLKAQQINQSKSEFVSMLSHDIRNPLNTILLAAGLLQNNSENLTKEKKTAHYQLIRSAIKNMAQLLDEVSFIGQSDLGKFKCELISLNLEAFCRYLVEEFNLIARDKSINIIFTCIGQMEETLWDETILRHILGNLLNNAIKYSPANSQVNFELVFQENIVIFKIQDWGIGIPEEDLKQIFQPFRRAGNVGGIAGTGLGLAITKKCVDTLGGEISVNSQMDVGTEFKIVLPKVKG
ncbi:ATP-binding protein [Calothrix sp. PCC 6303]|uniref:hybrid sensor histidine kinase/response regulator n=1 Tax=Calothrix sp. PCC 6303 TaxID=1170562 RepID=UPI0002A0189E|nr:ATP-binding protein [Calothrix sp. PCC 6303]AFY99902.1 response regulator receiver sensor signal transduction histidine kinase [Calothrix sp. PCC 6303]